MIHAPHTTQYPAYKDSGVEWMGEIPDGWEVKKLKHTSNIRNSSVDRHQYEDELSVKIVHYPDAYKNEVITNNYNFVTGTCSKEELIKFQLSQGDVIITKDSEDPSDIGVPCYIADNLENVVCGYHLTIISSNNITLTGAYLSRFLQFSGSRNYFETQANGITRFGLGQYAIFNIPIPIPPLAEQNAIARYLDEKTAQVDQLIQQSEKIIALLREQRAATINHAVTKGLTHLPPEQGGTLGVPLYPSGVEWIGDVPEGWNLKKLKHVSYIRNSSVDRHQYEDELSVKIVHYPDAYKNEAITNNYNFVTGTCSKEELIKFQLSQGDVIITKDSEDPSDIGVPCYIADNLENVVCGYHLTIISSNNTTLTGAYLGRFLQFSGSRNYFETQANGITRFGLGQYAVFNFPIPVPPLSQQNAIAHYLDEKTAEIDALARQEERRIELLREYRAALISEVVTGKMRVPETA